MARRFQSILETVGHTPAVRINRLAPDRVNLYVKIEAFNPLGSVKDRLALGVIEAAEQSAASSRDKPSSRRQAATPALGSRWCAPRKGIPSCSRWRRPLASNDGD